MITVKRTARHQGTYKLPDNTRTFAFRDALVEDCTFYHLGQVEGKQARYRITIIIGGADFDEYRTSTPLKDRSVSNRIVFALHPDGNWYEVVVVAKSKTASKLEVQAKPLPKTSIKFKNLTFGDRLREEL